MDTSAAAAALGLVDAPDRVDGYLAAADLDAVVARHGLVEDVDGPCALRATDMDLTVVRTLVEAAPVLAALDLAESLDFRERRAGLNFLDERLRRFSG